MYPVVTCELRPKVLEERPRSASTALGRRRREAGPEVANLHDGPVRVVADRYVVQLYSNTNAVGRELITQLARFEAPRTESYAHEQGLGDRTVMTRHAVLCSTLS